MRRLSNDEVFTDNSFYARQHIKRRIIQDKLKPYICSGCGNTGEHNGKPLVLQLEHINGKSEDNRLENLCFLCPNCHSQTETYAGKASCGKRGIGKPKISGYRKSRMENDRKLLEELKKDASIRFGEWGWKTRLCSKIGIASQKATPWLKRVDPVFLEQFERTK